MGQVSWFTCTVHGCLQSHRCFQHNRNLNICRRLTSTVEANTQSLTRILTYDVYGAALVCFHPNTIPTQDYGTIEVSSGSDCCSWCNECTCHYCCDSELKWWVVREYPTLVTRKKRSWDAKGWNVPLMSNRRNCTGEGHCISRTWSLHTGLQLSSWNWNYNILEPWPLYRCFLYQV